MRGRERAVTDRWIGQLVDLTDQLHDIGVPIGPPALEGGGVTSTIEPRKTPLKKEEESDSSSGNSSSTPTS